MSEENASNKSYRRIDPSELTIDHSRNTRPYSMEDAVLMADSYEHQGQLQAIIVRKNTHGNLEVVDGFHRAEGALIFNSRHPEQPMKLTVSIKNLNDEEAYIVSAVANARRTNVSPVVIAEQQRHMMEDFGMSVEKVASLYGMSDDKVYTLAKICQLPKHIKMMITTRELPVVSAIELTGLDRDKQLEVLGMAERKSTGRIKGESVREAVKKIRREKDSAIIQRSIKDIMSFLEEFTAVNEQENVRKVARMFMDFREGKCSEKKARTIFSTLGGAVEAVITPGDSVPIADVMKKESKKPKIKTKAKTKKTA